MKLLDALISIRDNGPVFLDCGICYSVHKLLYDATGGDWRQLDQAMGDLAQTFVALGVDRRYPVEGGEEAYDAATNKWIGVYGFNRWELLHRCIAYLESGNGSGTITPSCRSVCPPVNLN